MNHTKDNLTRFAEARCRYQHQYDNEVFTCKVTKRAMCVASRHCNLEVGGFSFMRVGGNHTKDNLTHFAEARCRYQHHYDNEVFTCKVRKRAVRVAS